MTLQTQILEKAANQARGLAIDAVHACDSGHLGLPLGLRRGRRRALRGRALAQSRRTPVDQPRPLRALGGPRLHVPLRLAAPERVSRLPLDEIKRFRQLHSKTPGPPGVPRRAGGVEATTGPLGQGVGNAVGMAVARRWPRRGSTRRSTRSSTHHVVCLAGDGCMQEGVAMEAMEFAGHQKLDNLILIYDSNDVTLDAMADKTQSENTAQRFKAIGWDVQTVDGHDMARLPQGVQPGEEGEVRQAPAHHRQDDHRQGHPRGPGDPEGARRGRGEVCRRGPRGPWPSGRPAFLRQRRGAGLLHGA